MSPQAAHLPATSLTLDPPSAQGQLQGSLAWDAEYAEYLRWLSAAQGAAQASNS